MDDNWPAVGETVRSVRYSVTGRLDHVQEVTVERRTAATVHTQHGGVYRRGTDGRFRRSPK